MDWDYFFPETYAEYVARGWGQRETEYHIANSELWAVRAALLRYANPHKVLPDTSGEELTFWERFKFSPDCTLFVAESHSAILKAQVLDGVDQFTCLTSFDAHHDAGYQDLNLYDEWDCSNWAAFLSLVRGVRIRVIYPRWKTWAFSQESKPVSSINREMDKGSKYSAAFDRLFVCKSGAWTPPWLDDQFDSFIERCPVKDKVVLPVGITEFTPENRGFDVAKMQEVLDKIRSLRADKGSISK